MTKTTVGISISFFAIVLGGFGFVGCQKPESNGHPGKGIVSGTESPITVRGGAMTIRTLDTVNGWQAVGQNYCSNVSDDSEFNSTGLIKYKNNPLPVEPLALTSGWSITLVGRVHNSSGSTLPSANGVTITQSSTACPTATPNATTPILLSPLASGYSAFYGPEPSVDEGAASPSVHTGKRFMDTTPDIAGASTHCSGPNSGAKPSPSATGDEDACERASLVTINSGTATYQAWCRNGECDIHIGK